MLIPVKYAFFAGALVLFVPWLIFFYLRKDIRKEMLVMSAGIGILSVLTSYNWWTVDWWRPETITGTRVGIEDFLLGFAIGGIMAVAYEVLFRKRLSATRIQCTNCPSYFTILLLLAFLTSWLFWGIGLTSFWASTVAMVAVATTLFYFRRDLFLNGVLTGVLTVIISLISYFSIILLSPDWINSTYQFQTLSGTLIFGISVEELVFWFLAGLVFGPFYEYWKRVKLKNVAV